MIFVDSNLFVIDLRYPDDVNYRVNRRALDRLGRDENGITSVVNVLEVCGILSFNLSTAALHGLYVHFSRRYRVTVVPGGDYETRLPAPSVQELLARMEKGMALKDGEIALVVEQNAAALKAFVSWNAKHFAGKLPIPALTPESGFEAARDRGSEAEHSSVRSCHTSCRLIRMRKCDPLPLAVSNPPPIDSPSRHSTSRGSSSPASRRHTNAVCCIAI